MARRKDSLAGERAPARRMRGFEAAAALVAPRVQRAAEGRGFAVARLLTQWAEVAGADIAQVTRPVRVGYGKGGFGATLTLLTTGPMAPMVEMRLPALRDRINACYGYNAIQRIVLTQTAPEGFAEGQASFTPASTAEPVAPSEEDCRQADDVAARFDDPALAEAMARFALNHAERLARKTRKDISC
ncbi:DUF721 domain-containing protein [Paracoccus sp. TK19116]|uniref:DUF721 domain-containing protein n=1 Tax=Paracoccus albicereus TaxID=2922394 RepID=A0ABT1MSV2_9RHOB|nr:DUF721 domain-containing protein [Paracoccus albicereus]MCQ0971398.1 DUF721 domain-containing protein [Paracoccus albicereus]